MLLAVVVIGLSSAQHMRCGGGWRPAVHNEAWLLKYLLWAGLIAVRVPPPPPGRWWRVC